MKTYDEDEDPFDSASDSSDYDISDAGGDGDGGNHNNNKNENSGNNNMKIKRHFVGVVPVPVPVATTTARTAASTEATESTATTETAWSGGSSDDHHVLGGGVSAEAEVPPPTTTARPTPAAAPRAASWHWEFQRSNGQFQPLANNDEIEAAFHSGMKSVSYYNGGIRYVLNFDTRVQTNTSRGCRRSVRRVPTYATPAIAAIAAAATPVSDGEVVAAPADEVAVPAAAPSWRRESRGSQRAGSSSSSSSSSFSSSPFVPPQPHSDETGRCVYRWEFQRSDGTFDVLLNSEEIDRAYRNGDQSITYRCNRGSVYELNFATLTQTSKRRRGGVRSVRRVPHVVSSSAVSTQRNTASFRGDDEYRWEFQRSNGSFAVLENSQEIERAYNNGDRKIRYRAGNGTLYVLRFRSLVQINRKLGYRRAVRRVRNSHNQGDDPLQGEQEQRQSRRDDTDVQDDGIEYGWEFQRANGTFAALPNSDEIEEAYRHGDANVTYRSNNGSVYDVDFHNFIQTNMDNDRTRALSTRSIRRVPLAVGQVISVESEADPF